MIRTHVRNALLASSALALLAACDGATSSPGQVGPVTIGGGDGGGNGGGSTASLDFVGPDGCGDVATEATFTSGSTDIIACALPSGEIVEDLTLDAANAYAIQGTTFVGENAINVPNARSATMAIPAGTVLFGAAGTDVLIVAPGSRIEATGSQNNPVIFTSIEDLADARANASARQAASDGTTTEGDVQGQWGGLVISGTAPVNNCIDASATPGTDDCNLDGEGGSGVYGGGDEADDSGTLRYVRVQYAGALFSSENELNGIAFQGVGSGTEVDYVQVHNNTDDGIEFFGGTVDVSHVVITNAGDDSIDWTSGWQGSLQYGLVLQGEGNNRGIEADGFEDNFSAEPFSNPTIANLTLIADGGANGSEDEGIVLRRNTNARFYNSVIVGPEAAADVDSVGIEFDGGEGVTNVPTFYSTLVSGFDDAVLDAEGDFFTDGNGNVGADDMTGNTLNGVFLGQMEEGIEATAILDDDPNAGDVDDTDFIGAFPATVDSISESFLAGWILPGSVGDVDRQGCPEGTLASTRAVPSDAPNGETLVCTLPERITTDTELVSGILYEISGSTFVGQDLGNDPAAPVEGGVSATLTIQPGVTIFGSAGTDVLVVTRGSRVAANGSAGAPIVFTSAQDLYGEPGDVGQGQWGGLVINGYAPVNNCIDASATPGTTGCELNGEGGSGLYGGGASDDDSGTLNYVRVQYAGALFSSENELNGIAFQGVGSGTDVNYIQVHANADDGVEFFGGTVNARNVLITEAGDDSIDWTSGWTGKLQYALVVQQESGNRGIEADNFEDNVNLEPRSNPTIANLTIISNGDLGGSEDEGILLRRGTSATIYNSLVAGPEPTDEVVSVGIELDNGDTSTVAPVFFSTVLIDVDQGVDTEGTPAALATGFFAEGNGNVFVEEPGTVTLVTASGSDTPIALADDGLAVGATEVDEADGEAFFEDAEYVGAVSGADDERFSGWSLEGSF